MKVQHNRLDLGTYQEAIQTITNFSVDLSKAGWSEFQIKVFKDRNRDIIVVLEFIVDAWYDGQRNQIQPLCEKHNLLYGVSAYGHQLGGTMKITIQ